MEVQQLMYMVMVQDMERAIRFYTDVVGFRERTTGPRWSELAFGDFTLALHIDETGSQERTNGGLSIAVTDLDSACQEIATAGGRVIDPPQESDFAGLRVAVVEDTEGNRMELGEHA